MCCREYGGVTGWGSLCWQVRSRWFDGLTRAGEQRPVTLVTAGDDIRPQLGIAVSAERLAPSDLTVVDGVRVTIATRSVCFEMRYAADYRAAVRIFDMAAYDDLVSLDELAEYASRHSGWTGIPQCRKALAYGRENSWSPYEVDARLVWEIDAGLPLMLCNQPVFDRHGLHIGTPDLLDVEAGVVVQYNGAMHAVGEQRTADARKEDAYRRVGLEFLTVVSTDFRDSVDLVMRMRSVRSRARFEAESRRAWTVDPPAWWIPTHTVDMRRVLDPMDRRRLLRYRAA